MKATDLFLMSFLVMILLGSFAVGIILWTDLPLSCALFGHRKNSVAAGRCSRCHSRVEEF